MALYAFDGTGNEDREGDELDSNVLDFFRAYDDAEKNDDPKADQGSFYQKGIGTLARTSIGEKVSEALGIGGHKRVRRALDRLENNVEKGDDVIDIVGFSRGAALAVSFGNEVSHKYRHLSVRFIGLWDVVGQFGLPGTHFNAGHDLRMPHGARRCYHAMALDEARLLFPLTRMKGCEREDERVLEVWFRGVHSDVGGGNGNRGLNWISLDWMYRSAIREGLPIGVAAVESNLAARAMAQLISDHRVEVGPARHIFETDCLHTTVRLEPGRPHCPHNNPRFELRRVGDSEAALGLPAAPAENCEDSETSGL